MITEPDWPTCKRCIGARVEGFDFCIAHLDPEQFDELLSRFHAGSDLDARGTTISDDRLARVREHVGGVLGDVDFTRAVFDGTEKLGPLTAKKLILDGARFTQTIHIDVVADLVSCVGTQFDDGLILRAGGAAIDMSSTVFGGTASITTGDSAKEGSALISLRDTDVSNLVVVDVDLSWCLFAGAYRLDQLRLEGRCRFNSPPVGCRWTRRQMLAEEYLARGLAAQHPFFGDGFGIGPDRLAAQYRSLRKAFEDSKYEAGAGDFYYGEMEMRRLSGSTPLAERWILTLYWLLSGYGQRAGRAVAAIVGLVVAVAALLFTVGLPGEQVWSWTRLDQSVRIGLGAVVFRDAGQQLTSGGSWTVMIARFLGPVLLALAVLAVRARVKR